MLDLDQQTTDNIRAEWFKYMTVTLTLAILYSQPEDKYDWMMNILFSLTGYALFHTATIDIVDDGIEEEYIRRCAQDIVKGWTVMLTTRLLRGQKLNEWEVATSMGHTLIGLSVFYLFLFRTIKSKRDDSSEQMTRFYNGINDVAKMLTTSSVLEVLTDRKFDDAWITSSMVSAIGLFTYHMFVARV